MLKTIKLTKDQLEPFLECQYQKQAILELLAMVKNKEQKNWERLGKQLKTDIIHKETTISHKKKTLTYFDEVKP